MTISMLDSIYVDDLLNGYPAYLGYADGNWPTAQQLAARFPHAHRVILTVTGATINADGIDVEPRNPGAVSGVGWAARKLDAAPGSRPVLYASVAGPAGYGMHDILAQLAARHIDRSRVRLLSAHYGAGQHICGPGSCGEIGTDMDGTQWTSTFPGAGGSRIDMSVLHDDFFGTPATVEASMALDDADVARIWAGKFNEYIDEGGDGALTARTVSDILFSAHRNTVQLKQQVGALSAAVAALQAKAGAPVDVAALVTALAPVLAPIIEQAVTAAEQQTGQVDAQDIANKVVTEFAAKLGAQ